MHKVTCAALALTLMGATALPAQDFRLTVLHNNDGESQLIDAGSGQEDFGGVARFKSLVDRLRQEAAAAGAGAVLLSSGDNFLAGPELNASLTDPEGRFFDAIALDAIGYDAFDMGNHEFDLGPDVLADFIGGFSDPPPFLSANLDFSGERRLQTLVEAGTIARSTVVESGGERIGVIGATTPNLTFISSPRHVGVGQDVAAAVQVEIDRLQGEGVNKIILISHLQSVNNDLELVPELSGVDVVIAGGGDELLANADDLLVPDGDGNRPQPFGPYPLTATNADGVAVPVITGQGGYRYLGRLEVSFDAEGVVTEFGGGPVRVVQAGSASAQAGDIAVEPDADLVASVVEPVRAAVEGLAANVVGASDVVLDGRRSAVRTRETNQGNLIADALLWQARQLAADFGVPTPDVALQNGGGIRNDSQLEAGDLSELDTFDMLPFSNFVVALPAIGPRQFKEILENAVSQVENTSGRFTQVAGFRMSYDPSATAQELDDDDNVVTPGERIVSVVLDDGRVVVENGRVAAGAPDITVVTVDFLARGGDQYPYRGAPFTIMGTSYQRALANYVREGLGGRITAADYPEGGEGRIAESMATVILYDEATGLPSGYQMEQNYPNPFNPSTTIRYALPQAGRVRLDVFGANGQRVASLAEGARAAGVHEVAFDAARLGSGVYFYRLSAGDFALTRAMLLVK